MSKLSPDELRDRLKYDFMVCQRMFGSVISGKAYRTGRDLATDINAITSPDEGYRATRYRVDFHIRTLVGKDDYSSSTTIGFNLEVSNYPIAEPHSWVISTPIPYSPHFERGKPVCTGDIWKTANGEMLFAELLIHVARLLNWDPTTTAQNYDGYNREARAYYNQVYGDKPLDPNLRYPLIPRNIFRPDSNTSLVTDSNNPKAANHGVPLFRPRLSNEVPDIRANSKRFHVRGLNHE